MKIFSYFFFIKFIYKSNRREVKIFQLILNVYLFEISNYHNLQIIDRCISIYWHRMMDGNIIKTSLP